MKEIDESNLLEYKTSLDFFLYKFSFLAVLVHCFLYFFPSIELSIVFSTLFLFYFTFALRNIFNKSLLIFFAEILVIFMIYLYFISWVAAYCLNDIWFKESLEFVVITTLDTDLASYFLAGIYLFVFVACILFFNKIIPVNYYAKTKLKLELPDLTQHKDRIFILLILTIAIEFFYFFSGLIGNLQTDFIFKIEGEFTTWWSQLFFFITSFHLLLNVLFFKTFIFKRNFFLIIFIFFSFIINLILFGYITRRATLVFFIVVFYIYILISDKKIKTSNLIFFGIIAAVLTYQFAIFATSMRAQTFGFMEKDATLKETLEQTGKTFLTREDLRSKTGKIMAKGFASRIIPNNSLPTLFYYNSMEKNRYSYGQLLFTDSIMLIPQIIFPGKSDFQIVHLIISSKSSSPRFKKDYSDSYYFYSYLEFGPFGLLIYPIIINMCLWFFYIMVNLKFFGKTTALYIIATIVPLLTIESIDEPLSVFFFRMRNIIIFAPFFNLLILNLDKKKE